MSTATSFTQEQINQATALANVGRYPEMYRYLSSIVTATNGDPRFAGWLNTAAAINSDDGGVWSEFVRAATIEASADMGVTLTNESFQAASDQLGRDILTRIIGTPKEPNPAHSLDIDTAIQKDVGVAIKEFHLAPDDWAGTVGALFPPTVGGLGLEIDSPVYQQIDAYYQEKGILDFDRLTQLLTLIDNNVVGGWAVIHSNYELTFPDDWVQAAGEVIAGLWNGIGNVISFWARDIFNNIEGSIDDIIAEIKALFTTAQQTVSPLILDLDGDGVETLGLASNIHFDHDGNGFAEQTGWVGKDDGMLVFDKNNNGAIDSGNELFGNNTKLANGQNAANGFAALADLDSNHDGVINSSDTVFGSLRVWKDLDSDGITDAGELLSLTQAGVQSINTAYSSQSTTDTNGTIRQIHDIWFNGNYTNTIDTRTVAVSAEIAALPNIKGFGNVADLQQAMARDASGQLKALVAANDSPRFVSAKCYRLICPFH